MMLISLAVFFLPILPVLTGRTAYMPYKKLIQSGVIAVSGAKCDIFHALRRIQQKALHKIQAE